MLVKSMFLLLMFCATYSCEQRLFSIADYQEQIHYYQDTLDRPQGPSIEIHSESYEEAIQILAQQEMNSH